MAAQYKYQLSLDPSNRQPPTRDGGSFPESIPAAKETKTHPTRTSGEENASLYFIGTATTLLEWQGLRILTDPNFLHAGDHVHLGPGVTGTRRTNPAIDLHELPHIDAVLLSHYHADHFDQKVEASLRRDLPIITTPHAKQHLHKEKPEPEKFSQVYDLDFFESAFLAVAEREEGSTGQTALPSKLKPAIQVTGTPGKHVPPGGILEAANALLQAVPPTNGWIIELGYKTNPTDDSSFQNGYRIYISGDTLYVDELKDIPEKYKDKNVDLMPIHLGGTTIPGPKMPLLMVTMDAEQGIKLMQLINPDVTIP